jgi:NadR type nicotinamide-nucleotide adenylyltransferase
MEKEIHSSVRKIVVVGPESTGKTTLAQGLANYFGTVCVEEFARTFLKRQEGAYTETDLIPIAKGQFAEEQQLLPSAKTFLICDTDALVVRIWSEWKYGRYDQAIEEGFKNDTRRYYLLTDIDLPWQADDLREHPDSQDRKGLFDAYHQLLVHRNETFDVVRGNGAQRLQNAVQFIKKRMNFSHSF